MSATPTGFLGVVLLFACLGCEGERQAPRDPSRPITPLELGAMTFEAADGSRRPLASGDPLLLHFWATWCAPCRRELPDLLALAAEMRHLQVVAVSNESWSQLHDHFDGDVPEWIARDPDGELGRALGVDTLPDTYLIDARGVARRRIAGAPGWGDAPIASWMRAYDEGVGSQASEGSSR